MAKKNSHGLGRGLEALMSSSLSASENADESKVSTKTDLPVGIEQDSEGNLSVDISYLKPNPSQPRQTFDEEALQELAQSIKENGIVEPIIIESAGEKNFFIIAGERRTRAAKIAGLSKVPVQLRRYSEQKKLEIALVENIQRRDLNPIEEANAYYNLMQMGDLSQDEVARKVGKNRSTVANAVRLLKLPEDMQKALTDGKLTSGHARALLSVVNAQDQRVLFGKIIGSGISVREAENLSAVYNSGGKTLKTEKKQKKPVKKDIDIERIEQEFIEKLGTKCVVSGTLEKGKIEIDYYSRSDLDRLYAIIAGA